LLVVSAKSPFKTMADLVASAKKSEIFYASSGIGNTLHLVAALFAERAGVSFKHLPFSSGPETVLALTRGEVGFLFSTPPAVMGLIESGELRAIGYAGSEPFPELPTVPLATSAQNAPPLYVSYLICSAIECCWAATEVSRLLVRTKARLGHSHP
jgi:tripartite-type tricarboxylate transporter receptor subunit TctC